MSAVERVQAAIDKLTALKSDSTPGPWEAIEDQWCSKIVNPQIDLFTDIAQVGIAHVDAEMIVTLHRTIDAQLAILNEVRLQMLSRERLGLPLNTGPVRALALADAILGDAS